ncbi:retropepsin-like aspartic protease [Asanoa siamensis]|uniref:retropepsin-like aspartic protease n=1 Tax=Asanoa siamensis TaxID=926357 RepID=UPI001945A75A|nr:retropepsin-like aspartic protease [Asanoa siamensis]
MRGTVTFDRVRHLVRVPVRLGGDPYRFLVDTGIGVTVVAAAVAARPDVRPTGASFSGQRMSGQWISADLVRLPPLDLAGHAVDGHVAAVADLGDVDGPHGFAGIIGLGFFENQVVTTDPRAMTLAVRPAEGFGEQGAEIPLDVRRHGPSVDPFTTLVLPSGREVVVEVDTGSDDLILDTRFLADCGVGPDDAGVVTKTGVDETGYRWTRRWATAAGAVHLAAAPSTARARPRVLFQDIVHDGLVGTDYLDRYRLHVDVTGARMVLSPHAAAGAGG